MPAKPSALVLVRPSLFQVLFTSKADAELRSLANVTYNDAEQDWTSRELACQIDDYEVVVTGWGSPRFTDEVLDAAKSLELVAHSAGSIKRMLPAPVFGRGVRVTHAAAAIAPAVAEMSLLLLMMLLRRPHLMDRRLREGLPRNHARNETMGQELAGTRVGVVGAGYTGRCFIGLLRCMGADVWVFDPYLRDEEAGAMGVTKAGLHDLLAECPAVSLQASATAETHHMIGSQELGLLQDGAILVNTARSWLIDEVALLSELESGRIQAALDVFDQEPLPPDHPFRRLENVLLTPHVAGATTQARRRQGQTVVDEIRRFLGSEPLQYEVTREMLETMA